MKVILAEKPSVARDIAKCLGVTQRKDGYIEGKGYQVTWAFGHMVELKEPDEYFPKWKRWTLETLPIIPEKFQFWELATRYRELEIKPATRLRNTVAAPVHFPSETIDPFFSPAPVAYRETQ